MIYVWIRLNKTHIYTTDDFYFLQTLDHSLLVIRFFRIIGHSTSSTKFGQRKDQNQISDRVTYVILFKNPLQSSHQLRKLKHKTGKKIPKILIINKKKKIKNCDLSFRSLQTTQACLRGLQSQYHSHAPQSYNRSKTFVLFVLEIESYG